jgi:hypothetical protein
MRSDGNQDMLTLYYAAHTCSLASHIALEDANKRMQVLSKRMLVIQEDERRAISRELHDDIGQTLGALKIGLHRLVAAPAAAVLSTRINGDRLASSTRTPESAFRSSTALGSTGTPKHLRETNVVRQVRSSFVSARPFRIALQHLGAQFPGNPQALDRPQAADALGPIGVLAGANRCPVTAHVGPDVAGDHVLIVLALRRRSDGRRYPAAIL